MECSRNAAGTLTCLSGARDECHEGMTPSESHTGQVITRPRGRPSSPAVGRPRPGTETFFSSFHVWVRTRQNGKSGSNRVGRGLPRTTARGRTGGDRAQTEHVHKKKTTPQDSLQDGVAPGAGRGRPVWVSTKRGKKVSMWVLWPFVFNFSLHRLSGTWLGFKITTSGEGPMAR